ncbi:MAG: TonB-dependent receptor [Tannerella sp.]|nr:TonB-dependent receptor [Tannerella sp.]
MRKIQALMMSVLLSGISLSGLAQESDEKKEDTEREKKERQQNLNREMTLEREYDPIVQDATKVNTLPVVREMKISKRPITYSDYAVPILPEKEMYVLPPEKLMTEVEHHKRNGYLHFGGGMLMNMTGDFGYHLLNTDRDLLSVYFSHRSANGTVEFEDETINKRKAKFNDNLGGLDFTHRFDKATLKLGGRFGYSAFNYYGMPTNIGLPDSDLSNDSITNQGDRLINVYGGVMSDTTTSTGYHIGIDYTNFDQKYSLSKELDGMTENHIGINFGISSPVNNGQRFGIDVNANILSYTAPSSASRIVVDSSAFDTHFNVTLNPYYRMESDTWKLLLGLNLALVSQNSETDVFVSPDITFDAPIANWSVFYAKLGGGIESNSMAELSRTNRYINPVFTADASKTWADLKLGVRSSATAGLWFDLFAGYKYTESDVLFNPSSYDWADNGFNNVSMAFQPTTQRIQVGATLKYDYKQIVDFYLKGVYNYYNLKFSDTWKNSYAVKDLNEDSDLEAYGKPSFVANAGINVRPVKPLTVSLDYCMTSGMYANLGLEGNVKMKTINDLRLRASWKFNDIFGAYAQFNNLLFQKRELYYGYPLQPFSVMAGFSVNF